MKNILNEKRRLFEIITYDNHTDVLFLIQKLNMCRYYTIYHDKDKYDKDTDSYNKGDIKKAHHHILVYFDNPRSLTSVSKLFHIDVNYIEIFKKGSQEGRLDYRVRYLVHYKSKTEFKFEYSIDDILTNDSEYKKYFDDTSKTKSDLSLLFDYFDNHDKISYRSFLNYVYDQDLWSTFKANAYIFNKLFDEHNQEISNDILSRLD